MLGRLPPASPWLIVLTAALAAGGGACRSGVSAHPLATGGSASISAGGAGGACNAGGACGCDQSRREVEGRCLSVEGQPCSDGNQCASNRCVDHVCCDTACDGLCERCDAPERPGTCALFAEDPLCLGRAGFACLARDRCRLPLLSPACSADADCALDHCELSEGSQPICCAAACKGLCQRCGRTGACDAAPSTDDGCPAVTCPAPTVCLDHRAPALHACAANGACAACAPLPARAGVPCGVGRQCDGAGACQDTGLGRLAAGARHTCAIRGDGNVLCWGDNSHGQLGAAFDRAAVGDDESPADVPDLKLDFPRDVVQLTAGFAHTCALFDDGTVRCWGRLENDAVFGTVDGLLGTDQVANGPLGFPDPRLTGDVRLPGPAVQISAGASGAHTCALLSSGEVVCWGFNADGECGTGTQVNVGGAPGAALPIVALRGRAVQVAAGLAHTCVVMEGGAVICWGEGNLGRLGYGDNTDRLAPSDAVPVGAPAVQVAAGLGFTCVVLATSRLRCWGSNNQGQLGYGHAVAIGDDETPAQAASLPGPDGRVTLGGDVPVGHGGNVVQVAVVPDALAACARFAGGAVRCWGQNDHGQLGYGHTETLGTRFTPDELELRPAGSRHAGGDLMLGSPAAALSTDVRCALLASGGLECWGDDRHGQLGLPAVFPKVSETLTPAEIGPGSWL